jgi:hypothetical protein
VDILDRILSAVLPLIDVERIVEAMVELAHAERKSDFDAFEASATTLQRRFHSAGIASEVLRFPADGRTNFQAWTAPIGFCTTRATCEIVAPRSCARMLGSRGPGGWEPYTAIVGTGHTGPQGVEGEVVHIHEQADLSDIDLAGKIAYCSTLHPASIRPAAVAGGAVALVSSYTKYRERNHAYVAWINTWDAASDGWLPTTAARAENLPGISISPAMGDALERCLDHGPVRVRVVTEGAYFESTFPCVTATLPGQEARWALLTGHLFEPGLTDNAAGVILGFWTAHVARELVERLPGFILRRGLRNVHTQECYGALALKQVHPQVLSGALAHLNVDMAGAAEPPLSLNPGLLVSTGPSGPLMRLILERARNYVPGVPYRQGRFDINCTLLADPPLGGVPTTQLEQVNRAWHTSRDRAGTFELDRDTLRYTALAAAAWAAFLVSAGEPETEWLLGAIQQEAHEALHAGRVADTALYLEIKHRELSSVTELAPADRRADLREEVGAFIEQTRASTPTPSKIVPGGTRLQIEASKRLYPKALLGGPAVDACFTTEQLAQLGRPKWSYPQLVLKSWADGTRSVYEITRRAIYETGADLDLGYALAFFEHYARQGIVKLSRER